MKNEVRLRKENNLWVAYVSGPYFGCEDKPKRFESDLPTKDFDDKRAQARFQSMFKGANVIIEGSRRRHPALGDG